MSPGNTSAEMTRKRLESFTSGVRLVWLIDPVAREVIVFTGLDASTVLSAADTLNGGDLLPGFQVSVRDLFAHLDRQGG